MASTRALSPLQLHLAGAAMGVGLGLFGALCGAHGIIGLPAIYVVAAVGLLGAALGGRWLGALIALVTVCMVGVIALAYTPIVDRLGAPLVRNDPLPSRPPDAVFVFGGGITRGGLVRGQALDRMVTGMALHKRLGVDPFVLSEMRADGFTGTSSRPDQRALLAIAGISDTSFLVNVHSTHDEAVQLAALARERRWRQVLLITSPAHTRRACASVERTGLTITCRSASGRATPWPPRTPTERLQTWPAIVYEYAAWLAFRTRGWAAWDR
jgi:uncharacterized SAM-binding protein YcdF (DUF218 family)